MPGKLELLKVETDTTRVYKPSDSFLFKLTFNSQEAIDEDVEFEITYFGDAYSEDHDQRICHNMIGPLKAGEFYFELETSPIDLTKIPIKTLFGLTTILIAGKFKGEQFIRIGYVVNVKYPGTEAENLLDSNETPIGEQDDECENSDDEGIEVMDDENSDDEGIDVMDDENSDDEGIEVMDDENSDDEGIEVMDDEEDCDDKSCRGNNNLEDALNAALFPKNNRKPVPLETPILAGQDEFEYKEIPMKQSKIELTLLEKPIVHVFDIDWSRGINKDAENVVISSENEGNVAEEQESKKPRTE